MRALVTGGAGFIGHHLVAELVRRGEAVTVLDSLITGLRSRLDPLHGDVRWIEGDVRDRETVSEAIRSADVVFHLAALPSVQRSIDDPLLTNDINVGGTIQVMEAAAAAGVRRVVLAGSSSVYGNSPALPRRESQEPDPRSPYAVSKVAAEQYTRSLGILRGVETAILRYFNVFGPGQDPESAYAAVVPSFVTAALDGRQPVVHGDGRQSRDFTYVDNVIAANILAATIDAAAGGTFNVACGESFTLLGLIAAIERASGRKLTPVFGPPAAGDVRDSLADISLAAERLGYRPHIGFERGIQLTVKAFAKRRLRAEN
jgi:UDP-glucose 4-epimerase